MVLSAKITATGMLIFRPSKLEESFSLAYILVCSFFLLKSEERFLARFKMSRLFFYFILLLFFDLEENKNLGWLKL